VSVLLWALDLLDDVSPELWAAAFLGVFGLLLIVIRHEDKEDPRE
jgi:hypothetical protein